MIPFVDRTYRTTPSDRGLLGHSYGGMFAIYVLEQQPALFQRIVAVSPVLGWDQGVLLTAARSRLRKLPAPVRLDLSVGDEADITDNTMAFARLLDQLKPAGLEYRVMHFGGENHDSIRLAAFPAGLYWVYRPAQ